MPFHRPYPRLPALSTPNALTRRLQQMQAEGRAYADLTISNPTAAGFDYPEAEIRAALAAPGVLAYHPDPRGSLQARVAVAAHLGHGVDPRHLHLCASTSEAYGWLFKLHGAPGDEVLVPAPSYPLFEHLAALEGLTTTTVPSWFFDRWHLDPEALEAACTARTRLVVVVNPNNPTGHFLSREEWRRLTELCARRSLALVVDEVFADFPLEVPDVMPGLCPDSTWGSKGGRRASLGERAVPPFMAESRLASALEDPAPPCPVYVLSGLSKAALLPQVKLGWIASRGSELPARLEALDFIADQALSVSAPAQAAAPALLELAPSLRAQVLARARANLARLDRSLPDHLSRLPVEGGWSVLLRRPLLEDDEACALRLLEAGVLVHPGHFFDLPTEGFLVLSLLAPEADFEKGLDTILRVLGG